MTLYQSRKLVVYWADRRTKLLRQVVTVLKKFIPVMENYISCKIGTRGPDDDDDFEVTFLKKSNTRRICVSRQGRYCLCQKIGNCKCAIRAISCSSPQTAFLTFWDLMPICLSIHFEGANDTDFDFCMWIEQCFPALFRFAAPYRKE